MSEENLQKKKKKKKKWCLTAAEGADASEHGLRAHRPWKPEVLEEGGVGEPGHRRGGVPLERQDEQPAGRAIPVSASGV